MEQHEIDTIVAMAQRQHGFDPHTPFGWVVTAVKMAYNLGYEHGYSGYGLDPWEHEDDIPF